VEIADALFAKFPSTDPLTLKFTKLHELITELEKFNDDPKNANEAKLEKIQMEWLELFSDV
jgi:FeS assembly protein IscX